MSAVGVTALARPRRERESLPLFDFQKEALAAILARRGEGIWRQLVSIPTGGGKTVLATHVVDAFALPAVFMCHRDELVMQTREKFREFDPSLTVAVCKAESGRTVGELAGRDVVIASAQTLAREARLAVLCEAVGAGGLLLVDEAHHSAAVSWARAIEALDPDTLIGLTATPMRGDGLGLDEIYQEIVYSVPMSKLVALGKLARPVGIAVGTGVSLEGVKTRGGEFVESQLEVVVNTPERNRLVVDAWEEHAAGRRHTIAFCVDVAHARALAEAFAARGHAAACVVGTTPEVERRAIYAAFREGRVNVLVSVMVLSEGFDEPRADCALMCRPTQSQSLYIQMAGRVLRRHPGKPTALVLDFVDVTRAHTLQTVMTLAGDDRPEGEPGPGKLVDVFASVAQASERKARVHAGTERLGDLLEASAITRHTSGGRWFVSAGGGEYLAVVPHGEGFLPVLVYDVRGGATGCEPLFRRPVDADTAMQIAEGRVVRTRLTERGSAWRAADVPATEAQRKAAGFAKVALPPGCTKGQASDLLDVAFFERACKRAGLTNLEVGA